MCDLHLQIPSNIVDIIRKVRNVSDLFWLMLFLESLSVFFIEPAILIQKVAKQHDVTKLTWQRRF